jgi:hypothetical protein
MHTCSELVYSFAFGHYSSYETVAELKKTLRVEQFTKEDKRTRPCKDIDDVPWTRGDVRKDYKII